MAVLVVCGVDEHGQRDILAIEPMLEESEESYLQTFSRIAGNEDFVRPDWLFPMHTPGLLRLSAKASRGQAGNGARSILCAIFWRIFLTRTKIPLPRISRPSGWPPPESRPADWQKKSADSTSTVFPKPSIAWKTAWRIRWRFMLSLSWMQERFPSTNVLERLNREIRRRTGAVGIFPSADAYTRLVTTYLMEYAEDWSASRAYLSEQSVQRRYCYRRLNFSFYRNPFCEQYLTRASVITNRK